MSAEKRKIIDGNGMDRILTRITHEIIERNKGTENLALIGIRSGGDFIAAKLKQKIMKIDGGDVPLGAVDIAMLRDDLNSHGMPIVGQTSIPFFFRESSGCACR